MASAVNRQVSAKAAMIRASVAGPSAAAMMGVWMVTGRRFPVVPAAPHNMGALLERSFGDLWETALRYSRWLETAVTR